MNPASREEAEANARLIMAATDYYHAAEAIREFVVAADRVDGSNPCSLPSDLVRALLAAHRKADPSAYAKPSPAVASSDAAGGEPNLGETGGGA